MSSAIAALDKTYAAFSFFYIASLLACGHLLCRVCCISPATLSFLLFILFFKLAPALFSTAFSWN